MVEQPSIDVLWRKRFIPTGNLLALILSDILVEILRDLLGEIVRDLLGKILLQQNVESIKIMIGVWLSSQA